MQRRHAADRVRPGRERTSPAEASPFSKRPGGAILLAFPTSPPSPRSRDLMYHSITERLVTNPSICLDTSRPLGKLDGKDLAGYSLSCQSPLPPGRRNCLIILCQVRRRNNTGNHTGFKNRQLTFITLYSRFHIHSRSFFGSAPLYSSINPLDCEMDIAYAVTVSAKE